MPGGGELPAACAGAVIDTSSDTPPALIGCFSSGKVDSWSSRGASFVHTLRLMYYCQDMVTVLANVTKSYFCTGYLLQPKMVSGVRCECPSFLRSSTDSWLMTFDHFPQNDVSSFDLVFTDS